MSEDRLIFALIFHESLLPRGSGRNGQALMVRPPETTVNRAPRSGLAITHFSARGGDLVHLVWFGLFCLFGSLDLGTR